MRRFVIAGAVCAFTFAVTVLAFADENTGRIYKVDGNKITWKKTKVDPDTKKAEVVGDNIESTVAADAVVEKGGKKGVGVAIEGGVKGLTDALTKAGDKGIAATITTASDGGKGNVTKIVTKGGGKKGA